MLSELSKKDKLWRETAYKICGNKNQADELVQEMYLRRYDQDRGQPFTDYYIFCTLRSIYLNKIKTNKLISVGTVYSSKATSTAFEPTDKERLILDRAQRLPYVKRELLELTYDYSLREIQKLTSVNYGFIFRETKRARNEILGDEIDRYKNKRLKHKKMSKKPNTMKLWELREKYPEIKSNSIAGFIKKLEESEQNELKETAEVKPTKSVGIGDSIAKILKATGVDKLIRIVVEEDCGCDERKARLNNMWHYKLKPKCLDDEEIDEYADWIQERGVTLKGGEVRGKLNVQDIMFVCDFYAIVFNTTKWTPKCTTCRGSANRLVDMIIKLDTVYYNTIIDENTES